MTHFVRLVIGDGDLFTGDTLTLTTTAAVDAGDWLMMAVSAAAAFGDVLSINVDDGSASVNLTADVQEDSIVAVSELWSAACPAGLGSGATVTITFANGPLSLNGATAIGIDTTWAGTPTVTGTDSDDMTAGSSLPLSASATGTDGLVFSGVTATSVISNPTPSDGIELGEVDQGSIAGNASYQELAGSGTQNETWTFSFTPNSAGTLAIYEDSGGGLVSLTGSFAAASSFSATRNVKRSLTGSFASASSFAGVRSVQRSLTGTFSAASSFSATPNVSRSLSGTFAAASTFVATTNVSHSLAGSFSAASTFTASPTVQRSLTGSFAAVSTFTATFNRDASLVGSFASTSTFSGTISVTNPGGTPVRLRTLVGMGT